MVMNVESLKADLESVAQRAQENINERLKLEGEYRRLELQIAQLEASNKDSEAPASEAVAEESNGPTPETE